MCIVLITTAHPSYALVILDNRDEFILRPTSRPHWWSSHGQEILSSRDLQRAEQGTWLGVTKSGKFAVLTNFRETDTQSAEHPVQGEKSRGAMVTAWLAGPKHEESQDFVHRLLDGDGDGVKGVGGFSLICGKLREKVDGARRELEPLAIISNRCEGSQDVPWIAGQRNEVYGLSNTSYMDPTVWPKVASGKKLLMDAMNHAVAEGWDEERLVKELYGILSSDTLPQSGEGFEQSIPQLRKSIFIPPLGGGEVVNAVPKIKDFTVAGEAGTQPQTNGHKQLNGSLRDELKQAETPDAIKNSVMAGCYGTQRQTIVLVGWDGKVVFRERALWDTHGKPISKGEGDVKFEFQIEEWQGEETAHKSEENHSQTSE